MPNDKYRVVLTCYDSNRDVPPYAEAITRFFEDNESGEAALDAAEEECRSLMDGFEGEGSFQVSEGGPRSYVAVNCYSVKEDEMDENACDIEPVTEYNIYPVHFYGPENNLSCSYRGFEVYANHNQNCHSIRRNDIQLSVHHSLTNALDWIDDLLLEVELSKSSTLKHLFSHGLSLDEVAKEQEKAKSVESLLVDAVSKSKDIAEKSKRCSVIRVFFDNIHVDSVFARDDDVDCVCDKISAHPFACINKLKEQWVKETGGKQAPVVTFEIDDDGPEYYFAEDLQF